MKRKSWLVLVLPALVMVATTFAPQEAQAQYYGGGGYRGGPPPGGGGGYGMPRWGFRHRVHGYVGGYLQGFVVAAQVTDYNTGYLSHGGGGGLFGGIRLGPFFSLELDWGITYHDESFDTGGGTTTTFLDSLYLMTFTLNGKIHIPTRGPIEPYFQAGIGFAYIGASYGAGGCLDCDSIFAKGPAFNIGGGLDFWMGPFFSLGGRLLYRGLYFTEDAFGNSIGNARSNFVNGVSLDVNIQFHF